MSNKSRWKLTDEQYEFIKGEVAHILTYYNIRCMPVSGFEIAIKMGFRLRPYSSLSKKKLSKAILTSPDGFFLEESGVEYIFYNDIDIPYERQNWTILHEIGHIVLDHTGHSEQEENEADFFAKYAIAPPVLVDRISPTCPRDIVFFFDISLQGALYAFEYYGKWKKHHAALKVYTAYESAILECYERSAFS